jgi:quercetin dioxygenase-like cupin family protein
MNKPVSPIAWKDIPAEPMNPLLTRQFVSGQNLTFARIQMKKGCLVPRHSHANEQIAFVAEGALRFSLGEEGSTEDRIVRSGELLVIPPHLPHAVEVLEDTINFDIFAPTREDWLRGDDAYLRQR